MKKGFTLIELLVVVLMSIIKVFSYKKPSRMRGFFYKHYLRRSRGYFPSKKLSSF